MSEEKSKVRFTIIGEPYGKGRPKFSTQGGFARPSRRRRPSTTKHWSKWSIRLNATATCSTTAQRSEWLSPHTNPSRRVPARKNALLCLTISSCLPKNLIGTTSARSYGDALNKIAFCDDAQIVDGRVIKHYAEQPRVEVEIWQLGIGG